MLNQKTIAREQLIAWRQSMNPEQAQSLSRHIIEQTIGLIPWESIQTLHIYMPLKTFREVDTSLLVEYAQSRYPTIRVASWRKTARGYQAYWLNNGGQAPVKQQFDVIIVPMLGFSESGHRIGFGGGFYDQFLAKQPQSITIGLCYESGRVYFEPEGHDIALHYIVTESRICSHHGTLIGKNPSCAYQFAA